MAKNSAYIGASAQAIPAGQAGSVTGVIVSQHTNGTLKLYDAAGGPQGRVLLETYTFPSGSGIVYFSEEGLDYSQGVWAEIGGTAVKLALMYRPSVI